MTRITRNIPADCCCDSWKKGIRTINGQYPDDNREFNLQGGPGIEITPITAGVQVSLDTLLPSPMLFRGTVGTGGTVETLPTADEENTGWTYVAISAGTTPDDTPKSYAIGDTLVSNGEEWIVIPSGNDPVVWSQITGTPTTLSGYGITDAISGSGNIGTDTKPIKVVNGAAAAVTNELVDVATQQTIEKLKIFKSNVSPDTLIALRTNKAYVSGLQYSPQIEFSADNTNNKNGVIGSERTSTTNSRMFMDVHDPSTGDWKGGLYLITDGSSAWSECPVRTYDASNTDDVMTIGSLQSSSDVLHTVNNESKSGNLTLIGSLYLNTDQNTSPTRIYSFKDTNGTRTLIRTDNTDANLRSQFEIKANNDNTISIVLQKRTISPDALVSSQTIITL